MKKLLALFLSICLMITLVPTAAFADENVSGAVVSENQESVANAADGSLEEQPLAPDSPEAAAPGGENVEAGGIPPALRTVITSQPAMKTVKTKVNPQTPSR